MRYAFIASVALLASGSAFAGPPFRTDDPVPVDQGHWEIYLFSMATKTRGDMSGTLAGIDANYGAAPDLQLHTTIPLNFDASSELGSGDGEIGAKYRFLTEDENGWRPQAAIYPAIDFPTGDASRNLGTGRTHVFLPLWVQKTFDPWVTFAGAEYGLNPGPGNRNFWYFGWAVQRQITANFSLGAELFHQTPDTTATADQTGFNVGAVYDLNEHYHLLVSVGKGIEGQRSNEFAYYLAVQWTF